MIRTQEMVPDWYIEKSRDFQVLCRLYDFTLNSLKYNIDSMQSLTATRAVKDTVLPLLGDKFGIYDKEAYSNRQLLEAYPTALKHKGSLKSIHILLNAFLDSMNEFTAAVALHSKDEDSAEEISKLLKRTIKPYSIVIILSTNPNLTNLHVLDEYLKHVVPSGLIIEYMFGVNKTILEKFKYKEYTFLFQSGFLTDTQPGSSTMYYRYTSLIKNTQDKYSATFDYTGTDNILQYIEWLTIPISSRQVTWTPPHTIVNKPGDPYCLSLYEYDNSGNVTVTGYQTPATSYTFTLANSTTSAKVEYYWNQSKEFIDSVISDIDVNAVGIAAVGNEVQ